MISDVDIRDWQKSEQEAGLGLPACGWWLVAAPFLLAAMANEYMWSRYSLYAREIEGGRMDYRHTTRNV
jgi:hypothetical protein